MRRVIIPAIAAAILASTSLAFAAEYAPEKTSDTVKAVDMKAMTLTLSNNKLFHLPTGWNNPEVTVGDEVTITYHIEGDKAVKAVADEVAIDGYSEEGEDQ